MLRHIRENEPDVRKTLAHIPFDLDDHATQLRRASCLIADVRVGSSEGVRRSSDGAGAGFRAAYPSDIGFGDSNSI